MAREIAEEGISRPVNGLLFPLQMGVIEHAVKNGTAPSLKSQFGVRRCFDTNIVL